MSLKRKTIQKGGAIASIACGGIGIVIIGINYLIELLNALGQI